MKSAYQMVVIGAGPAGMSAAVSAAEQGVEVAVIDEQSGPGGQIYRQADNSPLADVGFLGADYALGKPLLHRFSKTRLDYFPGAAVWYLDRSGRLGVTWRDDGYRLNAERIVIASGAQERPMPFPGWHLPGVMTAGAAQILLKSAALVPRRAPLVAGSGPLLLLLVTQLLRAGVSVDAILETTPRGGHHRALAYLPRALLAADYLFKGWQMLRAIRRARIPWYQASDLRAAGDDRLRRIEFQAGGKPRSLPTELLFVHQGVVPNLQLAEAAGCRLGWSESQQCWQVGVDRWGETSQNRVFAIGDCAAIGGARAAALSGRLAGLQVAMQCGNIDLRRRNRLAHPLLLARARHLAIRPWLDAYYRYADIARGLDDETLVCRCEAVSAARIRQAIALGCAGPNQVKAYTRCGMGPCQGRFCAATLGAICAGGRIEKDRLRQRPPIKPITLGQLAQEDRNDRQ